MNILQFGSPVSLFRAPYFRAALVVLWGLAIGAATAQTVNNGGILSVSPTSAEQGATSILATIVLDQNSQPPVPPTGITPTAVRIGTIVGSSIQRDSYTVTATFDIPAGETPGAKDVDVEFPPPPDQTEGIIFRSTGAFEVLEAVIPGAPAIAILEPIEDVTIDGDSTTQAFSGTASDGDGSISRVEYRVRGGAWSTASGTDSWSFTAEGLEIGANLVEARAIDNESNESPIASRTIARRRPIPDSLTYVVVDTNQTSHYDDAGAVIEAPATGAAFHGQDAQYTGYLPNYQDNGDGTVTDLNTGLMWQQTPFSEKAAFFDALADAETFELAGHDDWRLPTIKELYSLMDFSGYTGSSAETSKPYLDTDYFAFEYGDTDAGERFIDAQYWSATQYVGYTYGDDPTVFGVNFADGRIKGYPRDLGPGGTTKEMFVRYVRGNSEYGVNNFVSNGDGTVTDLATGLMWQAADNGSTYNWEEALAYAESEDLAGHDDWRLPNVKELQSIVDYTRAPEAVAPAPQGAAIDPAYFTLSNEAAWCWSGTTHVENGAGNFASYVAFGMATGIYEQPEDSGNYVQVDVHGAGAQRGDPKSGDPTDEEWVYGHGPQNDEIRIYNYVLCVRDADLTATATHGFALY